MKMLTEAKLTELLKVAFNRGWNCGVSFPYNESVAEQSLKEVVAKALDEASSCK